MGFRVGGSVGSWGFRVSGRVFLEGSRPFIPDGPRAWKSQ